MCRFIYSDAENEANRISGHNSRSHQVSVQWTSCCSVKTAKFFSHSLQFYFCRMGDEFGPNLYQLFIAFLSLSSFLAVGENTGAIKATFWCPGTNIISVELQLKPVIHSFNENKFNASLLLDAWCYWLEVSAIKSTAFLHFGPTNWNILGCYPISLLHAVTKSKTEKRHAIIHSRSQRSGFTLLLSVAWIDL